MTRTPRHHLQIEPDFALEKSPAPPRQKFRPQPIPKEKWLQRARDRRAAEKKQLEGIESQDIFKLCVENKLIKAGALNLTNRRGLPLIGNFTRCGVESFYVMCGICEEGRTAFYQCSQKWCPRCNWRIAMKRRELLSVMTKGMYGVKHVVLTQRNSVKLTRDYILASRKNLFDLRRQKILGKVTGGCASLEFTNEGRGWHMHWHMLIQSDFIDAKELSLAWGALVGQEFAIVKVKDVSEKSYLQEICKYVVEGSELAKWTPEQLLEFVQALDGTRCFSTFGKFRDIAKFARLELLDKPTVEKSCRCGCGEYVFGHDRQHCKRIATKKGY